MKTQVKSDAATYSTASTQARRVSIDIDYWFYWWHRRRLAATYLLNHAAIVQSSRSRWFQYIIIST